MWCASPCTPLPWTASATPSGGSSSARFSSSFTKSHFQPHSHPHANLCSSIHQEQFCKVVFIIHPHPIFTLILILMIIIVLVFILMLILSNQSIKNSTVFFFIIMKAILIWSSSSTSSLLIIDQEHHHIIPHFLGHHNHLMVITILMISVHHLDDQCSPSWSSCWSPSWWSVFTTLMISSHNLDPHADHYLDDQELVDLFNFHRFDNLRHSDKKKLDPRRESFEVSFWRKKTPISKSKETVAWVTPSHTNTETFTHARTLHNLKQSKVFLPLIWAIRQMRYSLDQNGTRKSAKVKKRRNFDPVFKEFCLFSMYKISKHFLLILLLGFIWSKPDMISFPNPIDFFGPLCRLRCFCFPGFLTRKVQIKCTVHENKTMCSFHNLNPQTLKVQGLTVVTLLFAAVAGDVTALHRHYLQVEIKNNDISHVTMTVRTIVTTTKNTR